MPYAISYDIYFLSQRIQLVTALCFGQTLSYTTIESIYISAPSGADIYIVCKHLIVQALKKNGSERLSAGGCLDHPWLHHHTYGQTDQQQPAASRLYRGTASPKDSPLHPAISNTHALLPPDYPWKIKTRCDKGSPSSKNWWSLCNITWTGGQPCNNQKRTLDGICQGGVPKYPTSYS